MRLILVATLVVAGLVAVPLPSAATGNGGHCDYNGDGYDDAAIGVPFEAVGAAVGAGAVNVLYGSEDKLTSVGNQLWTQNDPGIAASAEAEDFFGRSMECGDFNDDGYDDAVFSAPGEDIAGEDEAGAVHVLFGSAAGLTADDNLFLYRDAPGVVGRGQAGDNFGQSLAVGDFDGDGDDDLAVGAPFDNVDGAINTGSVHVFYGFAGGLSTSNDKIWHRGKKGVKGGLQPSARFGWSLVAGDFDGDGRDDLAIGAAFDHIDGLGDAGSVSVLYGSGGGLTAAGDIRFHRNKRGIKGASRLDARFGWSLAAGDFDGDGRDDLAIGVPLDDVAGFDGAGSVHVLYGSHSGLTPAGDKIWHRNSTGVRNIAAVNDRFGSSLATGRFNSGNKDDLAVGVYLDDVAGVANAGSVHVLYGSNNGLTASGDQIWHQGSKGINGGNQVGDWFGFSVSAGDFNDHGRDDLLIGVPVEDGSATVASGRVAVIYGRNAGLAGGGDQSWSQASPGILGASEDGDMMGWALNGSGT